jgi:predicted transposase/invertase (TIGR01784 family)
MKNIHNEGKLRENLVDFLQIAALYFREEKGLRFLEAVIRYLMSNMDTQATDIIKKSVEAISFEGAKTVMTIAESLIEKGIEKGFEKGIEKGKIEDAKNMKKEGFDFNTISRITGLTIEEIEKL